MNRTKTSVIVAAVLTLAAHTPVVASADEEPSQSKGPSPSSRWYGLPVVVTDVASDSLFVVIPPLGLAGVTLGAPLIHMGYGRGGMALASLGLRVTAEVLGFFLLIRSINGDDVSTHDRLIALAPMVAVQILDASLLSWNPRPRRSVVGLGVPSRLNLATSMTFSHLGASFGVGGTF
jgi:hypothetical protein